MFALVANPVTLFALVGAGTAMLTQLAPSLVTGVSAVKMDAVPGFEFEADPELDFYDALSDPTKSLDEMRALLSSAEQINVAAEISHFETQIQQGRNKGTSHFALARLHILTLEQAGKTVEEDTYKAIKQHYKLAIKARVKLDSGDLVEYAKSQQHTGFSKTALKTYAQAYKIGDFPSSERLQYFKFLIEQKKYETAKSIIPDMEGSDKAEKNSLTKLVDSLQGLATVTGYDSYTPPNSNSQASFFKPKPNLNAKFSAECTQMKDTARKASAEVAGIPDLEQQHKVLMSRYDAICEKTEDHNTKSTDLLVVQQKLAELRRQPTRSILEVPARLTELNDKMKQLFLETKQLEKEIATDLQSTNADFAEFVGEIKAHRSAQSSSPAP